MRLLLIEDDPMIGSAARRGLMQAGFAVDWVTDGHSAQAAIANAVYDALVREDLLGMTTGPAREGGNI